mgnify:CR=1 FL=1
MFANYLFNNLMQIMKIFFSIHISSDYATTWGLSQMVTHNMLRTHEGK